MLHQATVGDLRSSALTRAMGHIAVTMRSYPRGLRKELRDEYIAALSPERALFKDFYHFKRELLGGDHNAAFHATRYQARFNLTAQAVAHLERLARMSGTRDVYLVCQCERAQRCHRELLLILAKKWFAAETGPLFNAYPEFVARIPAIPGVLPIPPLDAARIGV